MKMRARIGAMFSMRLRFFSTRYAATTGTPRSPLKPTHSISMSSMSRPTAAKNVVVSIMNTTPPRPISTEYTKNSPVKRMKSHTARTFRHSPEVYARPSTSQSSIGRCKVVSSRVLPAVSNG